MNYREEQIVDFLKNQIDLKSAILNIKNINCDKKVIENNSSKVLFYFNKTGLLRSDVKTLLINYMKDAGWEFSDSVEVMTLDEIIKYMEIKIVDNVIRP